MYQLGRMWQEKKKIPPGNCSCLKKESLLSLSDLQVYYAPIFWHAGKSFKQEHLLGYYHKPL